MKLIFFKIISLILSVSAASCKVLADGKIVDFTELASKSPYNWTNSASQALVLAMCGEVECGTQNSSICYYGTQGQSDYPLGMWDKNAAWNLGKNYVYGYFIGGSEPGCHSDIFTTVNFRCNGRPTGITDAQTTAPCVFVIEFNAPLSLCPALEASF